MQGYYIQLGDTQILMWGLEDWRIEQLGRQVAAMLLLHWTVRWKGLGVSCYTKGCGLTAFFTFSYQRYTDHTGISEDSFWGCQWRGCYSGLALTTGSFFVFTVRVIEPGDVKEGGQIFGTVVENGRQNNDLYLCNMLGRNDTLPSSGEPGIQLGPPLFFLPVWGIFWAQDGWGAVWGSLCEMFSFRMKTDKEHFFLFSFFNFRYKWPGAKSMTG